MMKAISRLLLFWPTAAAIAVGRWLLARSEGPLGRALLRPVLHVGARWILYARAFPVIRPRANRVLTRRTVEELLARQEEIAVMPCSCRATAPKCHHPLHGKHEEETCFSFGFVALLQRMSGVAREVSRQEALNICRRAQESGQVHHAIISFGALAELCNCCPESCTVLTGYRRGVTDLVRPTGLRAARTEACDGCRARDGRICEDICPYGHAPGSDECRGCGLCAFHCPNEAIEVV